jgi:CheY-like chemotaxis protein
MRERLPDLPVVAVSGMATLAAVARSSDLSNVVCLQKPFRPIELIRAIEKARGSVGRGAGTQIAV